MLGKIEGRRRRGRQDEMVGWHHQPNGHEFEQTPGVEHRQAWRAAVPQGHRVGQDVATEQQQQQKTR